MVKKIVGVTACTAGIAHTYMAQAALEKAAKSLEIEYKIETQGSIGVENELEPSDIESADVVIIAADVEVNKERFVGKKIIMVDTNEALKNAKALIGRAETDGKIYGTTDKKEETTSNNKGIMKYLLSGLSDAGAITITSAMLLALVNIFVVNRTHTSGFFQLLFQLGSIGFTLIIPIFAAGIARAIGDKGAVAPAFIVAYMINDRMIMINPLRGQSMAYGGGFIGAIIVGLLVGYMVKGLQKIDYPELIKPTVAFFFIPIITTLLGAGIVYYIIGVPVLYLVNAMYGDKYRDF